MERRSSHRNRKRSLGTPLRVLALLRDHLGHVKPVEAFLGDRAQFEYDSVWDPDELLRSDPDVVVCVDEVSYSICRCLDAARAAGIPSIVLQDGVLEWRCQYENPRFGTGDGPPQHQPILADKIACIGPGSARHIASWGNAGKVEVTGMPRLDSLLVRKTPKPRRPGSRLLVMTARKPGFTEEQVRVVVRSLRDLKEYLNRRDDVEATWRLTRNLAARIGVENELTSLEGGELADQLSQVDAVITTPSTAMLEAMILDRPVGCLDYHNAPPFVPLAWRISAREHIGVVVPELLAPSPTKMAFQQECLRDALVCDSSAAGRVAELIQRVAAGSSRRHENGKPSYKGARVAGANETDSVAPFPPLCDLYPRSAVFQETDVRSLQVRLARAETENARLARELSTRRIGYWVQAAGRETARRLREKYVGGRS